MLYIFQHKLKYFLLQHHEKKRIEYKNLNTMLTNIYSKILG